MKKLVNLEKAIKELNAPTVFEDGEEMDSLFDFEYEITKGNNEWNYGIPMVRVYDTNERYSIDYVEEMNGELYWASKEFGFKYEPIREDNILKKLNAAIKKDLGTDYYFEWENNVVMSVVLQKDEVLINGNL